MRLLLIISLLCATIVVCCGAEHQNSTKPTRKTLRSVKALKKSSPAKRTRKITTDQEKAETYHVPLIVSAPRGVPVSVEVHDDDRYIRKSADIRPIQPIHLVPLQDPKPPRHQDDEEVFTGPVAVPLDYPYGNTEDIDRAFYDSDRKRIAPGEYYSEVHHHHTPPSHPVEEYHEGGGGDFSAIPGLPGIDYPTLSELPRTGFKCLMHTETPGFYADVETKCQMWHYCQPDGRHDRFLCPNGTIFDQTTRVCNWWFNVHCESSLSHYDVNFDLYRDPVRHQVIDDIPRIKHQDLPSIKVHRQIPSIKAHHHDNLPTIDVHHQGIHDRPSIFKDNHHQAHDDLPIYKVNHHKAHDEIPAIHHQLHDDHPGINHHQIHDNAPSPYLGTPSMSPNSFLRHVAEFEATRHSNPDYPQGIIEASYPVHSVVQRYPESKIDDSHPPGHLSNHRYPESKTDDNHPPGHLSNPIDSAHRSKLEVGHHYGQDPVHHIEAGHRYPINSNLDSEHAGIDHHSLTDSPHHIDTAHRYPIYSNIDLGIYGHRDSNIHPGIGAQQATEGRSVHHQKRYPSKMAPTPLVRHDSIDYDSSNAHSSLSSPGGEKQESSQNAAGDGKRKTLKKRKRIPRRKLRRHQSKTTTEHSGASEPPTYREAKVTPAGRRYRIVRRRKDNKA